MTDTTIQRFIDAAKLHGKGTLEGEPRVTNRAHKRLLEAVNDLRTLPADFEAFLVVACESEDPSVAVWAAYFLLPLKVDLAIATLERESKRDNSLISFGAKMVLREWQAGRLNVV